MRLHYYSLERFIRSLSSYRMKLDTDPYWLFWTRIDDFMTMKITFSEKRSNSIVV